RLAHGRLRAADVDAHRTFGRAVGLFGDGSVRLLFTPGHTAGHQSVLLRLSNREAPLTPGAPYPGRPIRRWAGPPVVHDRHRFVRSLGEIRRWVGQTPDALVITGHDRELWSRLEPLYE